MSTLLELWEQNGRKLPFKATDGLTVVNVEAYLSNGCFAVVFGEGLSNTLDHRRDKWSLYKEPREPRPAWKWFYKIAQKPYLRETREYYEHREDVIYFTGALKAWKNEESKIDLNKFEEQ